jgi:hypothetical protein
VTRRDASKPSVATGSSWPVGARQELHLYVNQLSRQPELPSRSCRAKVAVKVFITPSRDECLFLDLFVGQGEQKQPVGSSPSANEVERQEMAGASPLEAQAIQLPPIARIALARLPTCRPRLRWCSQPSRSNASVMLRAQLAGCDSGPMSYASVGASLILARSAWETIAHPSLNWNTS